MALPPINFKGVEEATRMLLIALGEDPLREGLRQTPTRVAKMYSEIFDGNFAPLKEMTSFQEETYGGLILVRRVPFYAFCEHHLALFHGTFAMGYVPNKKVLGLSKLVRVFRHGCKRPTIQERLTQDSLTNIEKAAQPKGAICYIEAEHTCMTLRGVKSPGSLTTTTAWTGLFETDQELRQMFMQQVLR